MLWLAVLGSQLGTWMQTVGAQWLLVGEPNAGTLVSLVQTAGTLPVLLLALPAGVLADSLDRRRMLIWVQLFQVAVGVALTGLTLAGAMTPALLLTLTFALGCGMAMTNPAYQAIIPELVPRAQIASAAALGAIGMNLARAAGPALAGLLVAHVGVAAVFALNAATFLTFAVVLFLWRRPGPDEAGLPEPFLAALGVGAVLGALVMPRLRITLSTNRMLAAAGLTYAVALVVVAVVRAPAAATVALIPAGTAWMAVLSNLGAEVQLFLPGWVRARGLGTYQMVFFGAQALGALAWGLIADRIGLVPTLLTAAGATALGAATIRVAPLMPTGHLNRDPATPWPDPRLMVRPEPDTGPILVEVRYTIRPENEAAFLEAMPRLRRSRLRTGAVQWGVFRTGETPDELVEVYVVASWGEHMRQHHGRMTGADEEPAAPPAAPEVPAVVHRLPVDG